MIQAFVTPPAKKHGRLAWLLKAAKAYLCHVAMAVKCLGDNKLKTSLKSEFALFYRSHSISFNLSNFGKIFWS